MTSTLILGDCIEKMKELPEESVDLILTDPPYGIDYLSPWTSNHHKLKNDANMDIGILYSKFLPEAKRVLKPHGLICCCCGGGGKRPVLALATIEFIRNFELIQTCIWSKGKTDGSFIGLGWNYRPSYETILVGAKDKDNYAFYPKYASNVFVCKPKIPKKGDHPTQKPIELMEFFILNHTKIGDNVLDPFMGGGTTGMACHRLQRNFIGIEISQDYFSLAEKRLTAIQGQKRLMEVDENGEGKNNRESAGLSENNQETRQGSRNPERPETDGRAGGRSDLSSEE